MDPLAPTVDDDPYEGARRPLAAKLTAVSGRADLSRGAVVAKEYAKFGAELWSVARAVLAYWAPSRLEVEALRRADDVSEPSLIAEEVARLTDRYQAWLVGQHDLEANWLGSLIDTGVARTVFGTSMLRERVAETLATIERRAMFVESRALDLRLRLDHARLRAELRREEFTSVLLDAMKAAAKSSDSDEHLKLVSEKLDKLAALEKRLGTIEGEVEFVADRVMDDFARRELQPPAMQKLKRLAEVAQSVGVKAVLGYFVSKVWGA